MCREAAPGERDGCVACCNMARRACVRHQGDTHVEVGPAVAERRWDTHHLQADAQRKVGRVKDLGGVGHRIGRIQLDVNVGVRPCRKLCIV